MKTTELNTSSSSWTPTMRAHHPQLVCDLIETAAPFATADLRRVRELALAHPELFTRGSYEDRTVPGAGCLLWHLSSGSIRSKEELTRSFTGQTGEAARMLPAYQAPKHIVRVWDHLMYGNERYGGCNDLPLVLFTDTLGFIIARRESEVVREGECG